MGRRGILTHGVPDVLLRMVRAWSIASVAGPKGQNDADLTASWRIIAFGLVSNNLQVLCVPKVLQIVGVVKELLRLTTIYY
jgi:hypothetical protein